MSVKRSPRNFSFQDHRLWINVIKMWSLSKNKLSPSCKQSLYHRIQNHKKLKTWRKNMKKLCKVYATFLLSINPVFKIRLLPTKPDL